MEINFMDILKLWETYCDNPIFWIIAIPLLIILLLWLWNFFNKQLEQSGLKKLISQLVSFVKNRNFSNRTKHSYTVTPSPKSGSPVNFWYDIVIWPILMSPFILFVAFNTTIPSFTLRWWSIVGWTTFIVIIIFGLPIYLSEIYLLLKTNNAIKKATIKLRQIKVDNNDQSDSLLDIFSVISDDLQMGFDPRVMPLLYKQNQIDILYILEEFMSLELVKPDKKIKKDVLAHRYYLTRYGATLVKRIKAQASQEMSM